MDQSRQAYDNGLAIAPNEEFLLLLRGSLLFKIGSPLAADDFRKAVRLKTKAPFPYLVLARDTMIEGNFQQGLKLSKSCFALSDNNRMCALAMEFIAICSYKLGRPWKEVNRRFDHALELDPSNQDIVQNREAVLRDAKENFANLTFSTGITPRELSQFNILDLKDVGKDTVSQSIINYINKISVFGKQMRTQMDDLEIPIAIAA